MDFSFNHSGQVHRPRFLQRDLRLGRPAFYIAALLALFLAYIAVVAVTANPPLVRLVANASANVLPVALLGLAVRQILRKFVSDAPVVVQTAVHAMLAVLFTILWFWLLMVLLGAVAGRNAIQFSVRPFLGPAATWQLFQGFTIYAAIAVAVHAEMLVERRELPPTAADPTSGPPQPTRLFVKEDDEIRPLDTDRIVLIRGADDYSQIVTSSGKHLVRMTLALLEQRLGEEFVRVHRSCLLNIRRIARAEPEGGGRMLLHLETGQTIRTSRAGSKLLRDRVI